MESSNPAGPRKNAGLLLCDDLMFSSRITGTARSLGLNLQTARSPADLEKLVRLDDFRCVIIDLANPGLVIADLVRTLQGMSKAAFIVAFGSHVDAAGLQAARDAGCDLVLPRSKFVDQLATALPHWFANAS